MDYQTAITAAKDGNRVKHPSFSDGVYITVNSSDKICLHFPSGTILGANLDAEQTLSDDWEVVPKPHGFQVHDTVEADDLRFEIVYIDRLDLCALTIKCTGGSRCGSLGKSRHVSELKFISRPDKPEVHVFERVRVMQTIRAQGGEYLYYPYMVDNITSKLLEPFHQLQTKDALTPYRLTLEKMAHDESEED